MVSPFSWAILLFPFVSGCEKDVQRVCSESPEEHLQPFKDKMEAFVLSGEHSQSCIFQILNFQEGALDDYVQTT